MPNERPGHRNDIDGLRAIAALAVVSFHFLLPFADGGYLGVDLFFVISGYLIFGSSLSHLRTWNDVGDFYQRRIARIIPALTVTFGLILLVARCQLSARETGDIYAAIRAGAVFTSNHYFFGTTDYFDSTQLNPALHLWTISVEEQFYFLAPLLLLLVSRRIRTVGVLGIASFAAFILWKDRSATFYLLPFRAWEFCLGASLVGIPQIKSARISAATAAAGLLLTLVGFHLSSGFTPGNFDSVLPALGAGFVLLGGSTWNPISAGISCRPLANIGRWSYSIYLLHWPLWVAATWLLHRVPTPAEACCLLLLTLAAAWAMFRFVETPFRRTIKSSSRKFASIVLIASMGTCWLCAFTLGYERDRFLIPRLESSVLGRALNVEADSYAKTYRRGTCLLDPSQLVESFPKADCIERSAVFVWGDSMAAHLVPGLLGRGLEVSQMTAAGCPPLLEIGDPRCREFNSRAVQTIESLSPRVVVVSGNWSTAGDNQTLLESLSKTLKALSGSKVVLVGQGPSFSTPVSRLIPDSAFSQERPDVDFDEPDHPLDAELADFASNRQAEYFSIFEKICARGKCALVRDGELIYWDSGGHLSPFGSALIADSLSPTIERLSK